MKKALASISVIAALALAAAPAYSFGDVTPTEAYELATTNPDVYILDVRTPEEWKWVGHPGRNLQGEGDLLDGKVVQVPWKKSHKGTMIINPSFLSDVDEIFGGNPNVVIITMCRSGVRGVASGKLLEAAGYMTLNMVPAFEGGKDIYGYRTKDGWKIDGLPYSYSGGGYTD